MADTAETVARFISASCRALEPDRFPSILHGRIIRPKSPVPPPYFHVRRNGVKKILLALGYLVASASLLAHHGAANVYDMSKPVMLKGKITKFEWTNPHNQIFFDVTDEKGTVSHWVAATEPPQVMLERGWTRRSLKEGDEVTVYVFAAKNGAKVGNVQRIVLADGKELTAAGPAPAPAAPAK
jgi:hypothetical protein